MSSSLLKAQGKKAGDKLNIALVGIGAEGEVLLNSILKLPNLNIIAVCDIWEYRRKYGFIRIFKELKQKAAQYEDYKDLIAKHAKELDASVIICHKTRERANVVGSITAIGDVAGKNVIIVDDMIDTAGTLTKAANVLKEMGALSVRACATHAVFSGNAYERIANSALEEVIVTDTIPLSSNPDKDKSKITVLSVADMFANIIYKVYNDEPISPDFII